MTISNHVNEVSLKKLEQIYPKLHALKQKLEGVVHPSIIQDIEEMQTVYKKIFEPYWQEERSLSNTNYEQLEAVREEEGLSSVWSISEINYTKMKDLFSKEPVFCIEYESWGPSQKVEFSEGKIFTWLDMWKHADKLIKNSGDTHHIYVEGFSPVKGKKGYYKMYTGS